MNRLLLVLALVFFASCNKGTDNDSNNNDSYIRMLPEGRGSFMFTAYKPLSDKPVNIYYHIPQGTDMTTAPIVMVFHGMSRNADDYRDYWISSADKFGFMIFCPEFLS